VIKQADSRALVIGAGLAGAAATVALARRGWRITLVDAASGPAQAASALPVGMLSPHVTRAPTPLSRLSALGVVDTRRELERLVPPGAGWQPCEVDNLDHDLGRWPAALVRPGALVSAWLHEAQALGRLDTVWSAKVARLQRADSDTPGWQVLDEQGRLLGSAPVVVVASAHGGKALLLSLAPQADPAGWPLRPVKGQLSLGALMGNAWAPRPQRRSGVFVPRYEDSGLPPHWPSTLWAMGSTYLRGADETAITEQGHHDNARSLSAMLPEAAERFQAAMAAGQLLGWAGVRCASLDRLPLVGAVPDQVAVQTWMQAAGSRRGRLAVADAPRLPGLFLLTALGSRGLSLAHWCAERLARQIDGAADDVEVDLVRALDPARFAWKLARRQTS
jgi:tRNA 5-methylaminomethyl-2-thiouridine biosynthesis bifunctional protein